MSSNTKLAAPRMIDGAEAPPGIDLYDWDDHRAGRQLLFDAVKEEMQRAFPIEYGGFRLEAQDIDYADKLDMTPEEEREALLNETYAAARLRGTLLLKDAATGKILDKKKLTLMRVPYLTDRGTFLRGGNEYSTNHQYRLEPGAYSRIQDNGELETQISSKRGTGEMIRVALIPETGQYRLRVKGSDLHLYSILKDAGVSDEQLEASWGPELLAMNKKKYDPQAIQKAVAKIVKNKDITGDAAADLKKALYQMKISRWVVEKTLPNYFDRSKTAEWQKIAETKKTATQTNQDTWAKEAVGLLSATFGETTLKALLKTEKNASTVETLNSLGPEMFGDILAALAGWRLERIKEEAEKIAAEIAIENEIVKN